MLQFVYIIHNIVNNISNCDKLKLVNLTLNCVIFNFRSF